MNDIRRWITIIENNSLNAIPENEFYLIKHVPGTDQHNPIFDVIYGETPIVTRHAEQKGLITIKGHQDKVTLYMVDGKPCVSAREFHNKI